MLDRSDCLQNHGVRLQQELAAEHATRLVRHAADLEEEAKRSEAKAFYLAKEAEHLQGGAGVVGMDIVMLNRVADALEAQLAGEIQEARKDQKAAEEKLWVATQLEERRRQLKAEALSLSERADERAARAELRFPQAEQAVHHVETTRSTFIQARRNSSFMHARAEHLERQAEAVAKGAEALMQRASEKATEALEVKRRAQGAAVERLADDLEQPKKGVASADLHTAQSAEEAHRQA
ncbi:hypothetical protein CHLNCDRAFT_138390 [Chlorella variabilis]|uniref:Uncharacterized protein n=1 Tax=Chlorella variabilis TaxID=554065 RepID=E1ZMY5_CHLVA|nr:hypothetical protein CHLNCDRAFT_138390 [Chlorella variabilis]EFN52881.1 hypothetical protein CHLNCDRAFT_138390 [Chlorella variabilis]|eukprot:XP_005844983.1 hypothetical protein CHLNCDRAFT_138390 [Chlorella variabilis]